MNRDAFEAGRRLASPAHGSYPVAKPKAPPQLDEATMIAQLTTYQGSSWADRFKRTLEPLRVSEARSGGDGSLTSTEARSLLKLMTYKDEYEVARLHSDGQLNLRLETMFEGEMDVTYHLAPPFLSRMDPATGRPGKIAFGSWIRPVFSGLARARFLRGSWLDPFGYAAERREERALISEFEKIVSDMSSILASENQATVKRILELPLEIKGFGPVKQEAISKYRRELMRLSTTVSNNEAENLIDG